LRKLDKLTRQIKLPVIIKEVGAGISREAAEKLLSAGAAGIDVAGAGGTSWAGVETLRNKDGRDEFWDWGLPTSYCIKEVYKLKKKFKFVLIGSGGINDAFDMAKAFALGADMTASARILLKELDSGGVEGVINQINDWFGTLRKIMFLTNSKTLKQLRNKKLIRKDRLF
jgi:isopentenyl-diphosphate delta-isomerase